MDDPIESSLGTLYVVTVISAFLLGCLVLQGYRYFTAHPDDSRWMKYLIAFVVLLELALQMTVMQVSYTMSITHAGDPLVLSHITSSQLEPALLLSVFAVPVHEILYYWRIYTLLGWKWVCIIATVLSCGRTCGWIYYITRVTTLGLPAVLADTSLRWLVIFLFALTYFLGASIVVILALYLAQFRKTPGIGTRMLVQRLIMWTVSTSLIAMIPQLVSFILVSFFLPESPFHELILGLSVHKDERDMYATLPLNHYSFLKISASDLDVCGAHKHQSVCKLPVINAE
ncbi:hypothetical protein AB1N83_009439 [Pleurotus pulmonarius]